MSCYRVQWLRDHTVVRVWSRIERASYSYQFSDDYFRDLASLRQHIAELRAAGCKRVFDG